MTKHIQEYINYYMKETDNDDVRHNNLNHELYKKLINILESNHYDEFHATWSTLHDIFNNNPKLEVKCHKYDYIPWKGNRGDKLVFTLLVSLLSNVSLTNKRNNHFSIDKIITGLTVNEIVKTNILRFYRG